MICCEQTCNVSMAPSSCVICVRNTIRQRVDFFLLRGPAVWSGKRCSTSTFRSYTGKREWALIFHAKSFRLKFFGWMVLTFKMPTQSQVAVISESGRKSISMRIVPSIFFSLHGVEFLPDTLHAW